LTVDIGRERVLLLVAGFVGPALEVHLFTEDPAYALVGLQVRDPEADAEVHVHRAAVACTDLHFALCHSVYQIARHQSANKDEVFPIV